MEAAFNPNFVYTRQETLFEESQTKLFKSTDRLFFLLLYLQWAGAIVCALLLSPLAWEGRISTIHIHVLAAVLIGGLINLAPTLLIVFSPGKALTRHVVAGAQMLWSALLIHLSGGRVETHFHIFGSLAFLSFYRDWRVYITATVVVAADHLIRSFYWPQSVYGLNYEVVYGSLSSAHWRWLEHAAWVIFCDIFLIFACLKGIEELRELCRRQAKLEDASQAKSLFLANVSHELRTPMHGILSFSHFGQQKLTTVPLEKVKQYFDEIHESGSRLMHLLNDLLDLSKLEAHKVVYSKSVSDLREVVADILREMAPLLSEKELKVATQFIGDQFFANFDRDKISQVVRNLLSNAIKFSNPKTCIEIEIKTNQKENQIVCSVINQGVGVPSEELESIFDKFVQSSRTRTGAGGTGLGLSICKEIIEGHSGKVWAESDSKGKTTLSFALPLPTKELEYETR